MIEVFGLGGIRAKIIADSVNPAGVRLTTFEIDVHRIVWSEFMTHRVFSRNAASSRAVPGQRMIDIVRNDPAIPISFGKNQPGMQAKEELVGEELAQAIAIWKDASKEACNRAQQMLFMGIHKQVLNRILEPYTMMRAVVSATELDNYYALRMHSDADPHIHELAKCMHMAQSLSIPVYKKPGEWHLPYVEDPSMDIKDALKVSGSCCAQVSYRKLDTSLEKAHAIFDRLIESKPVHASPVEHQAMVPFFKDHWIAPRRNFVGWIQQRDVLEV